MKRYAKNLTKDCILYIDCKKENMELFINSFSQYFTVLTADNIVLAKEILEQNQVKIIIFGEVHIEDLACQFCHEIQLRYLSIIILISSSITRSYYSSVFENIDVFRFINKPWDELDLLHTLDNAISFYNTKREKQELLCDLQNAQERALESDRLKSSFLANLSHELRTPLNGIIGFLHLLELKFEDCTKLVRYQDIVNESCNRLIEMVDNLITTSVIHSGEIGHYKSNLTLTELFKALHNQFHSKALRKGLELKIGNQEDMQNSIVRTDLAKLSEILTQLLSNAIKFTSSGIIEFGIVKNKENVFFVKDTGIGISKTKQKTIFQVFRQESDCFMSREYNGNGLGLTIVKGLLEIVGGKIWLESTKGKGSCFYFTFPLSELKNNNIIEFNSSTFDSLSDFG